MANPAEADLKPGYKSVESPKSHHTGGTGLSGGDVFVDGNPNYQITRGSDIGTGLEVSGLANTATQDSVIPRLATAAIVTATPLALAAVVAMNTQTKTPGLA